MNLCTRHCCWCKQERLPKVNSLWKLNFRLDRDPINEDVPLHINRIRIDEHHTTLYFVEVDLSTWKDVDNMYIEIYSILSHCTVIMNLKKFYELHEPYIIDEV